MNYEHDLTGYNYAAYPELVTTIQGRDWALETPWCRLVGKVEPGFEAQVSTVCEDLQENRLELSAITSLFFREVCHYPVCFIQKKEERAECQDPFSLYSKLRRTYLISRSRLSQDLNISKGDIRKMIRLNLFVTELTDALLALAAESFPASGNLISSFRVEESGHHKLIKQAADEFGCAALQLPTVVWEFRSLLEKMATSDRLGFFSAISFFEGFPQTSTRSPFAEVVKQQTGNLAAARKLQAHFDLNRNGGHDLMVFKLLATCPDQSERQANLSQLNLARMAEIQDELARWICR